VSIETILNLGDDSLANSFEIIIPTFPGALDVNNTILRVTKFEVPKVGVNTYKVDYKTQTFTKPNGKNATPNELTFDFRIDKYWKTYEGFENWKNIILSDDTGIMSPDVSIGSASLIRVPIDVIPVDSANVPTKKGWTFTGCFITDLTGVGFDQSNGEPLTATVTMNFIKKILRT
jgi:hypothetical protein